MKLVTLLLVFTLSGCAGFSSRCGYDWNLTEICEARFHHFGKPGTFTMYAYNPEHQIVPLSSSESSSILAPFQALSGMSGF